jgi:hypothetical protein
MQRYFTTLGFQLTGDTNEALTFMTSLAERVSTPATQDAYVYALVEAAALKLILGETDAVRKDLDAAAQILDTFDSVDPVIHAAYYRLSADYYSVCHTLDFLTFRAKLTILIITAMRCSIWPVYQNHLLCRKRKHKSVHII